MLSTTYRTASAINDSMVRVYNHMMLAVLNSMLVSYLIGSNAELVHLLFATPLKWVILVAVIGFAFVSPILIQNSKTKITAQVLLHAFAALMGVSMSGLMAISTGTSIVTAFMGAVVLFGTMSVYGYLTKTSLNSIGKYLFVALIAIIIASIINMFIGSTVAQMVISAISILVFMGLTAYDTQTIREMLMNEDDYRIEVVGALTLYLDFINIFVNLLNLNKSE